MRYTPDRKAIHPAEHLAGFSGVLQADGYAGFERLYETGRIAEAACWAHVRRKFYDIEQATGSPIAKEAIGRIGELYAIEAEIRGRPPDERREQRQARAAPLLDELRIWLHATLGKLSSKGELAVAIRYALTRWAALARYASNGRIEIDNNAAERSIRDAALGRKNWLFAGSDAGGERACRVAASSAPEPNAMNRVLRAAGAALLACVLPFASVGCSSIDLPSVPREPSTAVEPAPGTRLHDTLAPRVAAQRGRSGFAVLERGLDAFVARAALAELAERSLDLQYYIVHGDTSTLLLLGRVLAAADRGVRLRLLIDDWTLAEADEALSRLDAHPSIEIRLFNPAANRSWWSPARWIETLGDVRRINRRMHNKAWIADNEAAVVGGRNLGDEYFEARDDLDYHDLDLLSVGPVVPEISASFDTYWNSEFAVPLETFRRADDVDATLEALRRWFEGHERRAVGSQYARALSGAPLAATLREGAIPLHWGEARLLADDPEKLKRPEGDPSLRGADRRLLLAGQLSELAPRPRRELLAVAPYFVPGDAGVASFGALVRDGVAVRVLTNSLMSNDALATQAGYARYREALLRAGVALHELKPSGPGRDGKVRLRDALGSGSRAALHEKSFVIDRSTVFVGSLNLDPRSVRINTEVGVLVRSEGLAAEVAGIFERNASPQSAWRVELRDGRVAWIDASQGGPRVVEDEPGSNAWHRFLQWLFGVIAPESLL